MPKLCLSRPSVSAPFSVEHENASSAEAADAADNRGVLAKVAVAGERHEIDDQPGDVIEAMRPLGVPRHQHLLPWRQPGVALPQEAVSLGFEPADLLGDVEPAIGREVPQLGDLAFELGDRPFEIEEMAHQARERRASGCALSTSRRNRSPCTWV